MNKFITLFKRIFKADAIRRVFTLARFYFLLVGSGLAAVYTVSGNILASMLFACLGYIIFRYGQIKGYVPNGK